VHHHTLVLAARAVQFKPECVIAPDIGLLKRGLQAFLYVCLIYHVDRVLKELLMDGLFLKVGGVMN